MNASYDTVMFVATRASVGDAVILWTLVLGIFYLFWFIFLKMFVQCRYFSFSWLCFTVINILCNASWRDKPVGAGSS
jgi:hypothetical protein